MIYQFNENEFSSWDLLQYFKKTHGRKINGSPFTNTDLVNWVRLKKVPDLYGGFKVISTQRYLVLGNLLVITLGGLTRQAMYEAIENPMTDIVLTLNQQRSVDDVSKDALPRKKRTRLYYQLLPKSMQTTKKTLDASIIPKYFKEAGGKNNQLVVRKTKKEKQL